MGKNQWEEDLLPFLKKICEVNEPRQKGTYEIRQCSYCLRTMEEFWFERDKDNHYICHECAEDMLENQKDYQDLCDQVVKNLWDYYRISFSGRIIARKRTKMKKKKAEDNSSPTELSEICQWIWKFCLQEREEIQFEKKEGWEWILRWRRYELNWSSDFPKENLIAAIALDVSMEFLNIERPAWTDGERKALVAWIVANYLYIKGYRKLKEGCIYNDDAWKKEVEIFQLNGNKLASPFSWTIVNVQDIEICKNENNIEEKTYEEL